MTLLRTTQCFLALVTVLGFSVASQAMPVTRNITGTIAATSGSPANVGEGTVAGFVDYDDEMPVFDLGVSAIFELTDFAFLFSNGPTVTPVDTSGFSSEVEVDSITGELLSITIGSGFVDGLGGFGVYDAGTNPISLGTDGFSTGLFFSDADSNVVVEGSVGFAGDTPIPSPATFTLLLIGCLTLRWQNQSI